MQRQDYVLRILKDIGRFVSEIVGRRDTGRVNEALLLVVQAQEKLFCQPIARFASEPLEQQLALLATHETREAAHEKAIVYAGLLEQAGLLYHLRGDDAPTQHALGASLHVLLLARNTFPELESEATLAKIQSLVQRIDLTALHAPTVELLEAFAKTRE